MRVLAILFTLLAATSVWARGEKAGDFDYYVLALSWSPTWCALEGDARDAEQCETDLGWSLHGLWPQYDRGWPSYCPTVERNPSRAMTAQMTDIMGSSGLAWHQWNKHGTCTGDSAATYYENSRWAYDQIKRPQVFRQLDRSVKIPASLVEEAFLKENPDLKPDMLTVTCRDGRIQEVRICLSKGFAPTFCTGSVARDCGLEDALFEPVR